MSCTKYDAINYCKSFQIITVHTIVIKKTIHIVHELLGERSRLLDLFVLFTEIRLSYCQSNNEQSKYSEINTVRFN